MNISVSTKVIVGLPGIAKDLDSNDRERLTSIVSLVPDQQAFLVDEPLAKREEFLNPVKEITIEELIDDYKDIETQSNAFLRILEFRADKAGLNMPVPVINEPEVTASVYSLFTNETKEITYEMYVKLLEYQAELNRSLAGIA